MLPQRKGNEMLADKLTATRIAVFVDLIDVTGSQIGRTALMKMCYFLQTLKDVQLGYEFSLYSYGPFDSMVLGDLRVAEDLSAIESSVSTFSGGYQYLLSTSDNASQFKKSARPFLTEHRAEIDWVAHTFGHRSASELELLSTIVYVNRSDRISNRQTLTEKVKHIKPHFSLQEISRKIDWLEQSELLLELEDRVQVGT
jgi:hypothetical protein